MTPMEAPFSRACWTCVDVPVMTTCARVVDVVCKAKSACTVPPSRTVTACSTAEYPRRTARTCWAPIGMFTIRYCPTAFVRAARFVPTIRMPTSDTGVFESASVTVPLTVPVGDCCAAAVADHTSANQ
jgi:hypothetical protein